MTRRNPQNPRYTGDGPQGHTRKSSSSAKIKTAAASSVYIAKPTQKEKRKEAEAKERERAARAAARDQATIDKAERLLASYKKWRRIWIILVVAAILGVIVSWVGSILINEGESLAFLMPAKNVFVYVGMGVGYVGIIAALIIDMKYIRPVRKAQEALARKESKKERQHKEEAAAAKAQKRSFFRRKEK